MREFFEQFKKKSRGEKAVDVVLFGIAIFSVVVLVVTH